MTRRVLFATLAFLALAFNVAAQPFGSRTPFYPITTSEVTAAVSVADMRYPELTVDRYDRNLTPGTTDMTTAIREAVSVADVAGGGTITFLPGATYLLSTEGTHNVVVPIQGADYTDGAEAYQYNVLLDGVDSIAFDLRGATVVSDTTNGGAMFLLDSVRNVSFSNGTLRSVNAHNAAGTDTTVGMHAIAATSQDRDSYGIKLANLVVEDAVSALYCFGTISPTFRVRGVDVENVFFDSGRYALAFHENCDNVTVRGFHAHDALRDYFVYGVNQHDVQITSDTGVSGFTPIIKAYRNDTKNIKVRYSTTKNVTGGAHFHLQSDYDTDTQATPKKLLNIDLEVDNSGGQVLPAVDFQVLRDGVIVNATTQVFDGIVLKGLFQNAPSITSTQAGGGGSLNTDGVVVLAGSINQIYNATGFYDPKQQRNTFTPVLKINNVTTGITFTTNLGQYWRDGRFIEVLYNIVLSSEGVQVGNLTLDLPVTSSAISTTDSLITVVAQSGWSGLSGPIIGFIAGSSNTIIFAQQGAASTTNVTNTHTTNTSRLQVHARYPLW